MTNISKAELAVAALRNGTVIDHIPSEVLFKTVKILGIERLKSAVTIGNNLDSKNLATKASSRSPTCSFLRPRSTASLS